MARKSVVTTKIVDGNLVFVVEGVGELTLQIENIAPDIWNQAMFHGFKQRIVDAAALSRNPANGQPATAQEKFEEIKRLVEHYNSGTTEWGLRSGERAEGGEAGLTYRAMAKVQGISVDEAKEKVKAVAERREVTTKAILAALRKSSPDVRRAMDELRADGADVEDVEGMLEELMGSGPEEETDDTDETDETDD